MPSPEEIRHAQEIRLKYLFAIYDRESRGDRFPGAEQVAADIGLDPDWLRIQGITDALRGDGYITGSDTAEFGLSTVGLTPAGRRLVETIASGAPQVETPSASVGDVTITGSQNVINVQQHSPGAQHAALVIEYTDGDIRRIREWLDLVDAQADTLGLSDQDAAEIREEAATLRQETERTPRDHSRIRRIGQRLARLVKRAAPSLASAGLAMTGRELFNN